MQNQSLPSYCSCLLHLVTKALSDMHQALDLPANTVQWLGTDSDASFPNSACVASV